MTMRRLDATLFARSGLKLSVVSVLLGLGVLVMAVAALNFANLATAQASARGRETGLRKVLGADLRQILFQSWIETGLLAAAALCLALGLLGFGAPVLRSAFSIEPLYFLRNGAGALVLLGGLLAGVTLLAGAYPALSLLRVRPVQVLRTGRARGGSGLMAKLLIALQFASASLLLILVLVAQFQRAHLERIAASAGSDSMIMLNETSGLDIDLDVLKSRLETQPGIQSVTFVDRAPWSAGRAVVNFARTADAGATAAPSHMKIVRYDYFETFGLPLLAGREFSPERDPELVSPFGPDAAPMVIDRAFAAHLGFSNPEAAVGQTIFVPPGVTDDRPAQPLRIIGVAETETTRLEASDVGGHVYLFAPWRSGSAQYPVVRIDRDNQAAATAAIRSVWSQLSPNVPVNPRYFDDLFADSFRTFTRVGQIFTLLAAAAFAISTTGLLGIAVHVAARRRHEIAVRKTLGSTTWGAVRLLLADFSKPVIVANLIAWPLGYVAAQTYLSAFAHRIDLSIWPFALSMLITLAIAWLAVGGQTFKAASVRPAQVLRDA